MSDLEFFYDFKRRFGHAVAIHASGVALCVIFTLTHGSTFFALAGVFLLQAINSLRLRSLTAQRINTLEEKHPDETS